MADSRAILFTSIVQPDELARFIVSQGGQWQDHEDNPSFRQGVFIDGNAVAFVRGIDTQAADLRFFSLEDRKESEMRCGRPVVAVLTVDYTKGTGGEELAKRIISKMLEVWEGIEFDNP